MKDAIAVIAPKSCDCVSLALNLNSLGDSFKGTEAFFRAIEKILKIPFFHFQETVAFSGQFVDVLESVSDCARDFNRTCLLLAGGFLDQHVTTTALAALAKGLDVYLLNDVLICSQPKFEHLFLQRLAQAGSVHTTLAHCLFQWTLTSQDESERKSVLRLANGLTEIIN